MTTTIRQSGHIFVGRVEADAIPAILDPITTALQAGAKSYNLGLSSYGGNAHAGLAIYHALRGIDHNFKLTIHNIGFVASSAVFIFLAGDHRLATQNSVFVVHEPGTDLSGGFNEQDLDMHRQELLFSRDAYIDVLVGRTKIQRDDAKALIRAGTYLRPPCAKRYGLISAIADFKFPHLGIQVDATKA